MVEKERNDRLRKADSESLHQLWAEIECNKEPVWVEAKLSEHLFHLSFAAAESFIRR